MLVLAPKGKTAPMIGQGGATVRDRHGALRITDAGVYSYAIGRLIHEGPVDVPDSLFLRTLLADGDLVACEEVKP